MDVNLKTETGDVKSLLINYALRVMLQYVQIKNDIVYGCQMIYVIRQEIANIKHGRKTNGVSQRKNKRTAFKSC